MPRVGTPCLIAVVTIAAMVSCAPSHPQTITVPAGSSSEEDAAVAALIERALEEDAHLRYPDSAYAQDAEIINEGMPVSAPPLFAAVGDGGAVAITSSRAEVTPYFAWSVVDYRWVASNGTSAREGIATFVLQRSASGTWRIVHAHSSAPVQ